MNEKELCRTAIEAMQKSYSPYSGYCVGAALLAADGTIFTGCNIENASYPATICAERSAVSTAVSAGVRRFAAIAIVGGPEGVLGGECPPCGICRQVLSEFCSPAMPVYLGRADGITALTLGDLLPHSFTLTDKEN